MGRINRSDPQDLEKYFPQTTTRGVSLAELFEKGRYFARLHTCSMKDAADGGQGLVTSAEQLWTRLATSARACNGIQAMRRFDERAGLNLYLFPWNNSMETELEYRVFCSPDLGKIAAISQYKWHEPWLHAHDGLQQQRGVAESIQNGAKEVYGNLMATPAMTEEIRTRGFSFDINKNQGRGSMKCWLG